MLHNRSFIEFIFLEVMYSKLICRCISYMKCPCRIIQVYLPFIFKDLHTFYYFNRELYFKCVNFEEFLIKIIINNDFNIFCTYSLDVCGETASGDWRQGHYDFHSV